MELWKDIKGYEGIYQISSLGRVKTLKPRYKNKEFLKARTNVYGYKTISLYRKTHFIHRLVAIAFIENNNNKPCVNHLDGNKFNNTVENLEWCTYSENNFHANKMGLAGGIKHNKSKFNSDDITEIRENYKAYDKEYGVTALSKKFNVSRYTIIRLVNGKYYKNEKGKINNVKFKINEETKEYIRKKYIPYDKKYSANKLSRELEVSVTMIIKIAKNKRSELL